MGSATALDALNIARMAWERSQPQYTIEGFWDGLDEREESRLGADASPGSDGALPLVEPEPGLSEALGRQPGLEAAGNPEGLAEPHGGLTAGRERRTADGTDPGTPGERLHGTAVPAASYPPAASPSRLTPGAEPHRTPGDDLTAVASTVPPATPPSPSGGSAPLTPAEEVARSGAPANDASATAIRESSASAGTTPASNGGSAASSPQKPRGAPA